MKTDKKEYFKDYYKKNKDKINFPSYHERLRRSVEKESNSEFYQKESLCKWNYTDKEIKEKLMIAKNERWITNRYGNENDIEWDFIGNKSHKFLCKMIKVHP